MGLHHIAIWTFRLEELKDFYVRYFGGKSNEKYVNPKKGFESYFISFGNETSLELMSRTDVQNTPIEENRLGLTHLAFTFSSPGEILRFTWKMRKEGYTIAGEPRVSGDGYFESVILDPDGNRLECVYNNMEVEKQLAPELTTERLLLRPFQDSDAEAIFASCQNPKLGDNAGWPAHKTLEESYKVLYSIFIGKDTIWAITLKDTRKFIGFIGLMPDPHRHNPQAHMIGYWLDEAYWGKRYMPEAVQAVIKHGFEELHASLISGTCYPHNERSANVLKRSGFTYEGTLHQAITDHNNCTYDLQYYYLTVASYNQKKII